MIIGIGNDIIEVERVKSKIEKEKGFREAVFSGREIQYCEFKPNAFESYAARFAAKEAFLKALGMGLFEMPDFKQIEIINNAAGKPEIFLSGKIAEITATLEIIKIHVTVSHIKALAMASVVLESKSS